MDVRGGLLCVCHAAAAAAAAGVFGCWYKLMLVCWLVSRGVQLAANFYRCSL